MDRSSVFTRSLLTQALVASSVMTGASVAYAQQTATLTITDGATVYTCTMSTFGASGVSGVAAEATVSNCTPPLGGSQGGGSVTPPAGPVTVVPLTTTSSTPTITGTVTLAEGETFSVVIGARTYSVDGSILSVNGTAWTLNVPAANALGVGTYNVVARISNSGGGVLADSTSGELVIQSAPTQPGADPGYGSGLWQPPGTTNLFVADQSGVDGSGGSSIVPGCINGGSAAYGAACRENKTYVSSDNRTVRLTQGQILSLRYRPNQAAAVTGYSGSFQLSNVIGGNIVYQTTVSLSTVPGDFSNTRCTITSTRRPSVLVGNDYCPIDRTKSVYYLNIRVDVPCTECVFTVGENSAELY